jgi:hypothetical protein
LTSQNQPQTEFNDRKKKKIEKFISLTALPLKKGKSNCDLRERLLHWRPRLSCYKKVNLILTLEKGWSPKAQLIKKLNLILTSEKGCFTEGQGLAATKR